MQNTTNVRRTPASPTLKRPLPLLGRSLRVLTAHLVLLPALLGCAAEPVRAPVPSGPPRSVQLARAERLQRPVTTEVVGTVRALRSASIAPLISGTISEVRVGLGSRVRAHEVLVQVAAREVGARLEQADAALALAKRERDRASALHGQDVISSAQYDAALSQFTVAEAKQTEARSLAEHALLRAPFAAVVSLKRADVGDTVLPGQTLLVLEAPGSLRFEARVPEAASSDLAIGTALPVRLEGLEHDVEGRIAEIEPGSDDQTRTRLLKLDLPAVPRLQSGRFGRLLLVSGESLSVTVPAAALVRRGQLELLFVVDAGIARLQLVRSGRERDGWLEISSGLSGGERVVASAAEELTDGQRVEETE